MGIPIKTFLLAQIAPGKSNSIRDNMGVVVGPIVMVEIAIVQKHREQVKM